MPASRSPCRGFVWSTSLLFGEIGLSVHMKSPTSWLVRSLDRPGRGSTAQTAAVLVHERRAPTTRQVSLYPWDDPAGSSLKEEAGRPRSVLPLLFQHVPVLLSWLAGSTHTWHRRLSSPAMTCNDSSSRATRRGLVWTTAAKSPGGGGNSSNASLSPWAWPGRLPPPRATPVKTLTSNFRRDVLFIDRRYPLITIDRAVNRRVESRRSPMSWSIPQTLVISVFLSIPSSPFHFLFFLRNISPYVC